MTTKRSFYLMFMLPVAALVAVGCAPKSPEEKVAQLRSFYTARPIGFIVDAVPAETMPEAGMEEGGAAEGPAEEPPVAGGDGVVMAEAEPVAVTQNVRIDILLQHDSPEKLPGVTLDISMVDASETELASWKLWVDTAELPKATGTQFTHLLEDVDYQEGYAFSVEVRHPVPAEERGEYREFADAAGG
ncbi:MAG: hypothetical protein ACE5GX_04920 [Thermoanaerobaculia bacterium]